MASEIEVLAETPKTSMPAVGNGNCNTQVEESEDQRREDVYTAAAYGDLEKLKRLVEGAGASVSQPDGGGYFALQWSALNNRTAAAQYLIEHGADVNAADYTGQTALHWTAVRGSLQVAELLLQSGARLEMADSHGYRTTHVAAQYGHTTLLYHFVTKWGAEVDPPDNDGRSPLHWAAYKGFADCTRLLLFMDSYLGRQDKEGCTPLHWAAIRGNLEACTVLVQAGTLEDLMTKESAGCTAANLATDKGHRHVALFLSNAERIYRSRRDSKGFLGRIAKLGLAPILLAVVVGLILTFANSVVVSTSLIRITAGVGLWAWMTIFLALAGLFFFYRCSTKDPGYIIRTQTDAKDMNELLLKIDFSNPALAGGCWSQLCPTCKIVRPLRSKHCAKCDRCVEQFDHHCPWISNCVGKMNKWDFFIFLCLEVFAMVIGAIVTIQRLYVDPNSPSGAGPWFRHVANHHSGALGFLLSDIFLFFGVATLTGMQAAQIARNITTNEMANSQRYSYLKGTDGRFQNVYDHGIKKNCSDFLLNGFSSDAEVARPNHQRDSGGLIQMMDYLPTNGTHSHSHSHIHSHIKTSGDVNVHSDPSLENAAGGGARSQHHHVHSSSCNHNNSQALGIGLGLGLNRSGLTHQNSYLA